MGNIREKAIHCIGKLIEVACLKYYFPTPETWAAAFYRYNFEHVEENIIAHQENGPEFAKFQANLSKDDLLKLSQKIKEEFEDIFWQLNWTIA